MQRQWLAWGIVALMTATASSQTVGNLGDPANWHFHDVATVSAAAVKSALAHDFETLLASHPRASLNGFSTTLERRAHDLFLHAGFPDARLSVNVDEANQRVEISVAEGARWNAGEIAVSGVDEPISDQIKERLATPRPDRRGARPQFDHEGAVIEWIGPEGDEVRDAKVLWQRGSPAPFDQQTLTDIRSRVSDALAEAGYMDPLFACRVVPRSKLADLEVNISNLGPPSIIQEIQVLGNRRDSAEDIVRYLNINTGTIISQSKRTQVLRALWESGRFAEHDVTTERLGTGVRLTIDVAEAPGVPSISEPLNRPTRTLMKGYEWLTRGEGRQRDIVSNIEKDGYRGELVLSTEGVLFTLAHHNELESTPDYGVVISAEGLILHDFPNRRKLHIKHSELAWQIKTKVRVNPADHDDPFSLSFGGGFLKRTDSKPPLTVRSSLAPAYAMVLANTDAGPAQWRDGILVLPVRHGTIQVKEETGELLAFDSNSDGEDDQAVVATRFVANRFTERYRQLATDTADHTDAFNPSLPITSVARFVRTLSVSEQFAIAVEPPYDTMLDVVDSFIDDEALNSIDHLMVEIAARSDRKQERLQVPSSAAAVDSRQTIACVGIGLADHLFPRNSWPWSICREISFLYAGKAQHTNTELRYVLAHNNSGPLAHWVLSELVLRSGQKRLAAAIAARGRKKLSVEEFRTDCELLLARRLHQLMPVARRLGQLSEEERRSLAELLAIEPDLLNDIGLVAAKASVDDSPAASLEILETLWVNQWKNAVKVRLARIVSQATMPSVREAQAGADKLQTR